MTRRERLERILENFGGIRSVTGSRTVMREIESAVLRHGFAVFTDDAIEIITAAVVRNWRRTQRINRENRARARGVA